MNTIPLENGNVIILGDLFSVYHANVKLGNVVKLFTSKDDHARATTVKIHNQHSIHQNINCPVNKLHYLEICSKERITEDEFNLTPKNIPTDIINGEPNDTSNRPTHEAADKKILILRISGQI